MNNTAASESEEVSLPDWAQNMPYEDGVLHGIGQAPLSLGAAANHYARSLAFGAIASQINVAIEQESELSTARDDHDCLRGRRAGCAQQ